MMEKSHFLLEEVSVIHLDFIFTKNMLRLVVLESEQIK